jgi:hypothetical protein
MQTWIKTAVEYWFARLDESDLGVDAAEAHELCWRCGCKRKLQKCHIVARQFGGNDDASNILPLCSMCHDEAPDVPDPQAMWDWIKRTRYASYETFWAQRAVSLAAQNGVDLLSVDLAALSHNLQKCGRHFMQNRTGCRVKAETLAWAINQSVAQKVPQ